jgi:hypothetical protein
MDVLAEGNRVVCQEILSASTLHSALFCKSFLCVGRAEETTYFKKGVSERCRKSSFQQVS